MAEESDGVEEALQGAVRVALTAAGRVAEVAARAREQAARDAQAAGQHQAREQAARLDAERSVMRAQLAPVGQDQWWERAEPQMIARAWEHARAWEQLDPDAAGAAERIRREVRHRYGVDVDAPGGDPARVREALERRGAALDQSDQERRAASLEQAEAAQLLSAADRADRDRQQPAEQGAVVQDAGDQLYDSAGRRRDLAASLEGVADAETIQARVLVDTAQSQPASAAVGTAPAGRRARAARGRPGRGKQQQPSLEA